MTISRGALDEDAEALGSRGPVTGTVPRRHDRPGAVRHDRMARSSAQSSRRDAVLRVLLEAYLRDLGPGAFEAQ